MGGNGQGWLWPAILVGKGRTLDRWVEMVVLERRREGNGFTVWYIG